MLPWPSRDRRYLYRDRFRVFDRRCRVALVCLALTVAGQVFGYRAHHRPWPLFLAFASAVALYVLVFVHANAFGAYVAIAGLVLASVLNVLSRRTHQRSCER